MDFTGTGVGGLVGGRLFGAVGGRQSFLLMGAATGVYSFLFFVAHWIINRLTRSTGKVSLSCTATLDAELCLSVDPSPSVESNLFHCDALRSSSHRQWCTLYTSPGPPRAILELCSCLQSSSKVISCHLVNTDTLSSLFDIMD